MNRYFSCLVFTLASAEVCSGQYYDRIAHLKDAPFSAEVQGSETTRDSSNTWTTEIARAGDGSVYEAQFGWFGEFKGTISAIKIEDANDNCNIHLSPYRSHLTKTDQGHWVGGTEGLSIGLEAGKEPAPRSPTIEDIRDKNQSEQDWISKGSQIFTPDAKMRQTSLGRRTVDGMTVFGFQLEHRLDSKTDRVNERWESELGFTYSSSDVYPMEGRIFVHSLAGLKLVEPPAELFTVQDKYFPPTSTLPNARTIFISGLLDNAELRHKIESIVTASGRFTLAPDSKKADLVVLAKIDHAIPGYQAAAPIHQFLLEFNKASGGGVFWVTLDREGESGQWAQSPVLNTCFADLWKRVEAVQAPPGAIDEDLF